MKGNYHDDSWVNENVWGKYGADDERGAMNELNPDVVLRAVSLIRQGKIYDLETERFKGMKIWDGHCGFEILSYASPAGRETLKNGAAADEINWYKEGQWLDEEHNAPEFHMGLNTEMMIAPLHIGTHIDAFCHWTSGKDHHWYNGYTSDDYGTTFGPSKCDASKIPPMIMRGVLLDIAGYKGMESLPDHYIITAEDCEGCAGWEGVELKPGDAVFLRTGENWPEGCCGDAGVGISAARYLVEEGGAILIGDDMSCIDGFREDGSSSVPHHPQPVHHYLLIQRGVHIMEFVQLGELARDKVYEFCFICTPSKIRNATGMFVRPIAVV